MANILFRKGSYEQFKALTSFTAGTLYLTEDEGGLYLGLGGSNKKRIQGSVLYFDTLTRFENEVIKAPPYSTDVIYFIADEDALFHYTSNEGWKQLNVTASRFDALSATVTSHTGSITTINNSLSTMAQDIVDLKALTGTGTGISLADRIKALEDWKTVDYPKDIEALSDRIGVKKDGETAATGVYKYVDEQITAVDTKVTNLTNTINSKANQSDLNALSGEVTALSGTVTTQGGKIDDNTEAINNQATEISGIKTTLGTKADSSTVSSLSAEVGTVKTSVSKLNEDLAKKADQTALNQLSATVDTKAAASDVQALQDIVGDAQDGLVADVTANAEAIKTKADKTTVNGLSENLSNLTNTVNTLNTTVTDPSTGLVKKVGDLENTLNNSTTGLSARVTNLENNKADKTALEAVKQTADAAATKTYVEGKVSEINNSITTLGNNKADITYVDNLVGKAAEGSTAATGVYKYVDDEVAEVNNTLNSKIEAANAMVFKGTIDAWSDLPTSNVSIGDTYIVSETASVSNAGKVYYAGDLLVATGTETNGVITSGLTWEHVKTGYTGYHEAKLTGADNAIKLTSYTNQALGSVSIETTNENIKVSIANNKISIGMEWGSFDE